jgi:predicted CxxxxCH...CXXCH cytochrome family protein
MLGNMDTASPGVGSHQSHIAPATWHHQVECTECHIVPTLPAFDPTVPTHMNGNRDIVWGPLAQQGTFDGTALTCTGSYCHGGTLVADVSGKTSNRIPTWNTVDGSQKACGANCHTLPPGGTHPAADGCPSCHGAVIATFDPANPQNATWADASLHINGIKEVASLNCTSCHGDTATANPAPPRGTNGEMATTDPAVGAHERHLTASGWHRSGQCSDCHATPGTMTHSNGAVDFAWGTVSTAQGATPAFTAGLTCTGAYCHGTTLMAANTGGTINRIPVWNQVDGTWAACGTTCHTNPPGGTHVANTGCPTCHNAVIATYDPTTKAATWTNAQLHINGTVEVSQYHDLTNWVAPKTDANHHGGHYFVQNQQRDEHNLPCTQCHGADYNGGTSGVSCNNPTCHGGKDWKSCSFCHGTAPTQNNPPNGVAGETANTTLAVGRHVPHLTASTTHVAFACGTCHAVPAAGDVAHALQYVPSADLTTAGHHGDVAFVAPATGMVWNVAGVAGNPVNARGTCLGSCHSNGRGGPPLVTPYWAGGAWTVGSCTSCHANSLNNLPLRHSTHNGEATCTDCHPPASGSTHLNGTWDVKSPISAAGGTGSVTTAPPGGVCGVNWSCNGTCHGKNHNNLCWN